MKFIWIRKHWLFWLVIVLLYSLYGIWDYINFPPYSNHQWRQSDALSISLNYFHEGMKFWEPKIHFLSSIDGRGVGEFPILYFLNALVWKFTGVHFVIPRLIVWLTCLYGTFQFYLFGLKLLGNWKSALMLAIALLSSPLLIYYSSSYLSNAPGLILCLGSLRYFYDYSKKGEILNLIVACTLILLGGLLRPTMIGGIGFVYLFYLFSVLFKNSFGYLNPDRSKWPIQALILALPILLNLAWLVWIKNYNSVNAANYFLTTIRPIWEVDNLAETALLSWKNLRDSIFPRLSLLFNILLCVYIGFHFKRVNFLERISLLFISTFIIGYFALWFANLPNHNYYFLEFYYLQILLAFIAIRIHQNFDYKGFKHIITGVFALGLGYSIYLVTVHNRLKFHYTENLASQRLVVRKSTAENWRAYHLKKKDLTYNLIELGRILKEKGFNREDIFISLPDASPNISLALMDFKGFTSMYHGYLSVDDQIAYMTEQGAKYIVISAYMGPDEEEMQKHLKNLVFSYKGCRVFRISS